jgi:hypothetical protein
MRDRGIVPAARWALLVAVGGCTGECVDYAPNATVTSVCWDERENVVELATFARESYCTGTDEKRFTTARVTVGMEEGTCVLQQRQSNHLDSYGRTEGCEPLFEDGTFPTCRDCELRLDVGTTGYTLSLVTDEEFLDGNWSALMLHVLDEGEEVVSVALDMGTAYGPDRIPRSCTFSDD